MALQRSMRGRKCGEVERAWVERRRVLRFCGGAGEEEAWTVMVALPVVGSKLGRRRRRIEE